MKIYISGKITGLEYSEAYSNFEKAENTVLQTGNEAINPMKLVPFNPSYDWGDYMKKDIELLFTCDAIYMQRNWFKSKGARIELAIAKEFYIKVFYE